jgi:predicted nucleotidyltransferase
MVEIITKTKIEIISLYKSNYLAQYHVREMAKLIKKSHVTLLPHLKDLERDKIITAKSSGRNKIFRLNTNNLLTKNLLLLAETFKTMTFIKKIYLIKKITSEINYDGTVILFGSYAKQTFNEDSDIDIFCLGKITKKEIQDFRKIGKTYGKMINVKTSTIKNFKTGLFKKDPLIIEIIKNHILLQNAEPFIDALWRYFNAIKT